ncbi:hypothetical protein ACQKPT_04980 [Pseudomonas monteilii]|uniref:hypothetical protein n=1 Tax=Pseudomonas monteilii TaxID=76759 RepID=UPI003CFBCC0C
MLAVADLSTLTRLIRIPSLAADVRLDGQSRGLLISTEGATAPGVYEELVGESSDSVLKRQVGWLSRT